MIKINYIYKIIVLILASSTCHLAQALGFDYTLHTSNYTDQETHISGKENAMYGALSISNDLRINPATREPGPVFHATQGGNISFQGPSPIPVSQTPVQGYIDVVNNDGSCHIDYWYGLNWSTLGGYSAAHYNS